LKRLVLVFFILFLTVSPVLAQENIEFTVSCKYPNGDPAQNALVRAFIGDTIVDEAITDQSGMAKLSLPVNQTVLISATLFGWEENKTVDTKVPGKVEFTVRIQAAPIEKAVIPLRLTIWTPGGFALTFEGSENVNASIRSLRPNSKYSLTVRQGAIFFESSDTDTYFITIDVKYKEPAWRTISIHTYSTSAMIRTMQTMLVYSASLKVEAMVDSIIGPHYPTPDEIAKATTKQWQDLKSELIKSIVQEIRSETKTLEEKVSVLSNNTAKLTENVQGLIGLNKETSQFVKDNLVSFQANAWSSIALISVITIGLVVGVYYASMSRREEEVTITSSGEIRKEERKPKARKPWYKDVDVILGLIVIAAIFWLLWESGMIAEIIRRLGA
jgi:hypothetical protein